MPTYFPSSNDTALTDRLGRPYRGLAVCFCAAWCDTCLAYQPKFDALAGRYPDWVFVWADIEDHPELLGEEDVENFPTLLLSMGESVRFFGPMLPHISHLQRLLDATDDNTPSVEVALPSDFVSLLTGR